MPPNRLEKDTEDLNAGQNVKRLDDLEGFRKEFEGKEFDRKIVSAIDDSTALQKKIKELIWETFKEKVIWIILTVIALLAFEFARTVIDQVAQQVVRH